MDASPLFLGIDPGMSGGIALLSADLSFIQAYKMPETETDTQELLAEHFGIRIGFIEAVHSMPKQGVSSSFKFGQSYGFLRGLLVGMKIPFESVTPQKWQKEIGCMTRGDKNVSKAKAQQLFPSLKITHATADALLIAEFARRTRQV